MTYLACRKPMDENFTGTELRNRPRIYDPILLRVRGVAERGRRYEFQSVAYNISAGGFCATAPLIIEAGDHLFLFIRFSRNGTDPATAPVLAARGIVLRSLERRDGTSQFAAFFTRCRILSE